MKPRLFSTGLIGGALALFAVCLDANAATVTFVSATQDYNYVPTLQSAPNDYTCCGTVQWNVTANLPNVRLSPYGSIDNLSPYYNPNISHDVSGNYLSPYSVINPGGNTSPPGIATYNFASGVTSFSFLWGSPDLYNSVQFFAGLNGTDPISGATFYGNSAPISNCCTSGLNTNDVALFSFDGTVGSVQFQDSGTPAFEYSIPTTSLALTTPLPGGLLLFAGGLGVMGLIGGRRKKSKNQAVQAAT